MNFGLDNSWYRKASVSGVDEAYMKAVNDKDMNAAQGIIDNMAKSKGYMIETWRGEGSGIPHTNFSGRREPGIFTSQDKDFASEYANGEYRSSEKVLRRFYVKADRVLSLTNPDLKTLDWIRKWGEGWDDWTDRYSGEPSSAYDQIVSGGLFDYEGDWSMRRWHSLQRSARGDGFDVIIVPDKSHSVPDAISTIVLDQRRIKLANSITFDNDGQIILPTKRFDESVHDIRY